MAQAEMKWKPEYMNLELTSKCPLRCPQCYCTLEGGKNLPLETALHWIEEASAMGLKEVMLSGGETLCYPHLYEVIRAVRDHGANANVALSGWHFTQEVYDKLIESGVAQIFISLNGSTEEINSLTRDGYEYAIKALELLQANHYPKTTINWVMHSNNSDDFENMVALAEKYDVSLITIIGLKPDSAHTMHTFPSLEQMQYVKNVIKSHKGKVKIGVETCYSPMLAFVCDTKLFGNFNVGPSLGCTAGRFNFSVSVDGELSPCRHLEYYEKHDSLREYWENSPVLAQLRTMEDSKKEPCSTCRLSNNCRHCAAINAKLNHAIYLGHPFCQLHQTS